MEACPADLDKLSDLNQLVFDDAGLTDLPDLRLEKLMALKLRNNRLRTIPNAWLAGKNLDYCDLSDNRLERLPDGLLECRRLEWLDASSNQLKRFEVGDWPEMTSLQLNENRLTDLPPEIGRIGKMMYIHLAGNRLTKVPESIAALMKLQELRLSFNEFTSVPEFLAGLPVLRYAGLDGNFIPPDELKAFENRKRSKSTEDD